MPGVTELRQHIGRQLDYHFVDEELLQRAMTHRSAAALHNERLEFLGDAVLGFLVAAILHERQSDADEGELSRIRSTLVNRDSLAEAARRLNLGEYLLLGAGERKSGGRNRNSILCDAMEALLGAIYLDGGVDACREVILRLFAAQLDAVRNKDAKTRLQEWMQARGKALPDYQVTDVAGEEHDQTFHVRCHVPLLAEPGTGSGRTRRQAEQEAARACLSALESKSRSGGA